MKKFLELWGLSCLTMTITHFLGMIILMGTLDVKIMGMAYLLALIFSVIPTAIFSAIIVFGSPFIKNKNFRYGLQLLIGCMFLGFPLIMSVINTIIVLYVYHNEKPKIMQTPEKLRTTFKIYDYEIVGKPMINGPEQLVLSILKEKGAPISGIIYFNVEDGYTLETTFSPEESCRTYTFIK
jgi:hypothetical protein